MLPRKKKHETMTQINTRHREEYKPLKQGSLTDAYIRGGACKFVNLLVYNRNKKHAGTDGEIIQVRVLTEGQRGLVHP
jgi:hypothetical protein